MFAERRYQTVNKFKTVDLKTRNQGHPIIK